MNRIDKAIQEAGMAVDRVTAGTPIRDSLSGVVPIQECSRPERCNAETFSSDAKETLASMEEPKGWRELQQKALEETNTQRLIQIVDQLTSMLTAHERKAAEAYAQGDIVKAVVPRDDAKLIWPEPQPTRRSSPKESGD